MPDLQLVQRYECEACGDTGWVPVEGRGVTRCECVKRKIAAQRIAACGVPERHRACLIGSFQIIPGPFESSQGKALLAVGRFVDAVRERRQSRGVLLIGPVGVGKTHLAVGAVNELLITAPNVRCLFRDYRELLADIRDSFNPEVGLTESGLLAPVFAADVLVLDELGAERPTPWVLDSVSRLLNVRYNGCKATLLTTNFSDQPASDDDGDTFRRRARTDTLGDRIGEPMRSRLHEMCQVVELRGEDFRSRRKAADVPQATVRSEPLAAPTLFDRAHDSQQDGGDRR